MAPAANSRGIMSRAPTHPRTARYILKAAWCTYTTRGAPTARAPHDRASTCKAIRQRYTATNMPGMAWSVFETLAALIYLAVENRHFVSRDLRRPCTAHYTLKMGWWTPVDCSSTLTWAEGNGLSMPKTGKRRSIASNMLGTGCWTS